MHPLLRKSWILIPYGAVLLFLVLPMLAILGISLSEFSTGFPPYKALFQWVDSETLQLRFSFSSYAVVLKESLYRQAYFNSLMISGISTVFCLLLGYPMAYGITRISPRWQLLWLMLAILPFWTSFLVRVYAWMNLLNPEGVISHFLQWMGMVNGPITLSNTMAAVIVGIVYSYLPFMIFPLYATLSKIEPSLLEAAHDLGCHPTRAFWRITLPLSRPGIFAGASLVFIPAMGEYIIPELLGGPSSLTIGRLLWYEFFTNRDWPVACALAVIMIVLLGIPIFLFEKLQPGVRNGGDEDDG